VRGGQYRPAQESCENLRSPPPLVAEIRPPGSWPSPDLRSVWAYRELLFFLAWRDITVRYKQTALGILWVLLQPVLLMAVFSLFLGRLGGIPSAHLPYPVFVLSGLLPWQLFSQCLIEASNSLVANERIITKVYFPRLILPLAAVAAAGVDSLPGLLLLVGLLAYTGHLSISGLLALPLFLLLTMFTALAVALWLSALNALYRDVRHTLSFLTQFWFFLTPVVYPASLVPDRWRPIYGLNPMAGIVEGLRLCLFGVDSIDRGMFLASLLMVAACLWGGLLFFKKMEAPIGDAL
jgi:lipopolysaccharide transport system permease protein